MKYQMLITFPGELKVNAEFDGFTIKTDKDASSNIIKRYIFDTQLPRNFSGARY